MRGACKNVLGCRGLRAVVCGSMKRRLPAATTGLGTASPGARAGGCGWERAGGLLGIGRGEGRRDGVTVCVCAVRGGLGAGCGP